MTILEALLVRCWQPGNIAMVGQTWPRKGPQSGHVWPFSVGKAASSENLKSPTLEARWPLRRPFCAAFGLNWPFSQILLWAICSTFEETLGKWPLLAKHGPTRPPHWPCSAISLGKWPCLLTHKALGFCVFQQWPVSHAKWPNVATLEACLGQTWPFSDRFFAGRKNTSKTTLGKWQKWPNNASTLAMSGNFSCEMAIRETLRSPGLFTCRKVGPSGHLGAVLGHFGQTWPSPLGFVAPNRALKWPCLFIFPGTLGKRPLFL